MTEKSDTSEARLDALFSTAFPEDHPAMHDYASLKMELKRFRAAESAQAPVGEVTEPDRIHVGLVDGLPRIKSDGAYVYYTDYKRMRESLSAQVEALKRENEQWRTWGVIEVAIRNPSVSEYMRHWEGRTEAAEQRAEEAERKATFWQGSSEDWKQHKKRRDVELAAAQARADKAEAELSALKGAIADGKRTMPAERAFDWITERAAMLTAARTK